MNALAARTGITVHQLALSWLLHHSRLRICSVAVAMRIRLLLLHCHIETPADEGPAGRCRIPIQIDVPAVGALNRITGHGRNDDRHMIGSCNSNTLGPVDKCAAIIDDGIGSGSSTTIGYVYGEPGRS